MRSLSLGSRRQHLGRRPLLLGSPRSDAPNVQQMPAGFTLGTVIELPCARRQTGARQAGHIVGYDGRFFSCEVVESRPGQKPELAVGLVELTSGIVTRSEVGQRGLLEVYFKAPSDPNSDRAAREAGYGHDMWRVADPSNDELLERYLGQCPVDIGCAVLASIVGLKREDCRHISESIKFEGYHHEPLFDWKMALDWQQIARNAVHHHCGLSATLLTWYIRRAKTLLVSLTERFGAISTVEGMVRQIREMLEVRDSVAAGRQGRDLGTGNYNELGGGSVFVVMACEILHAAPDLRACPEYHAQIRALFELAIEIERRFGLKANGWRTVPALAEIAGTSEGALGAAGEKRLP